MNTTKRLSRRRMLKGSSAALAALGLVATTGFGKPVSAHANDKENVMSENHDTKHKPRIVLVHGAFADGTGWQHVIPPLEQQGYVVTAVQNPLTSLANDVATTKAIDERNYPRAYTYWENNGTASQQSYTVFAQGFAETDSVTLATGQTRSDAGAGSVYTEVPVVVFSQQRDGNRQSFCGTYRLRRANLPPFDTFGWRINSAATLQTPNVEPGSDTVQQLLNGRCAAK